MSVNKKKDLWRFENNPHWNNQGTTMKDFRKVLATKRESVDNPLYDESKPSGSAKHPFDDKLTTTTRRPKIYQETEFEGFFHEWAGGGSDGEQWAVAIVEDHSGRVFEILTGKIRFLDR